MVQRIYQNNKYSPAYAKYVADTIEDAQKIIVTPKDMGSEIFVIETRRYYILDSKAVWHSLSTGDTIICECGCEDHVEESTIWENLPE